MRCEKARRWISDDLDGALAASRKGRLESHLARCAACRAYHGDLELVSAGARRATAGDPSPEYWADFEARLERRLARSARPERSASRPALRRWAWAWAVSLVGAAAVGYLAFFRPGPEREAAWLPHGTGLSAIHWEAEGDHDLTLLLDLEVRASIAELTVGPDEERSVPFVDDPLFWEGISEEELRFIASELEAETDRGVRP